MNVLLLDIKGRHYIHSLQIPASYTIFSAFRNSLVQPSSDCCCALPFIFHDISHRPERIAMTADNTP